MSDSLASPSQRERIANAQQERDWSIRTNRAEKEKCLAAAASTIAFAMDNQFNDEPLNEQALVFITEILTTVYRLGMRHSDIENQRWKELQTELKTLQAAAVEATK